MGMKKQHDSDDCRALIEWAILEGVTISVSLKKAARSSIFDSRFITVDQERVRIVGPASMVLDVHDPILEVFITFGKDHSTFSFSAEYIKMDTHTLKGGKKISCLSLSLPEGMKETDRRNCERFYVENDSHIQVSFWTEADAEQEEKEEKKEEQENGNEEDGNEVNETAREIRYAGCLHDLSLSGIGISINASEEIPFCRNQKCNISIRSSSDQEMVFLPARYRCRKETENKETIVLGFQFTITASPIEGAKTLAAVAQIINHIQSSSAMELSVT